MTDTTTSTPRCVALVGPYLSGKTSLLESIMFVTGGIGRKGTHKEGNMVGDAAPEAAAREMSIEATAAHTTYLDDPWVFLDCPGSIEFTQEARNALLVADIAVVVCEPEVDKVLTLAPIFRFLDAHGIPRFLFVNKIDHAVQRPVQDVVDALKSISEKPFVLRHVPIREGEHVTGYVDLASEKAYSYKSGEASSATEIPAEIKEREAEARQAMLESLSDFDDALLEALLEDEIPPTENVYGHLVKNLQAGNVTPVLIGAAEFDHGVRRLLKALRHDAPGVDATAKRLGVEPSKDAVAQVFKTYHLPHAGKLSMARVLSGQIADGDMLCGHKVSGLFHLTGYDQDKIDKATLGEVVAMGRMDDVATGDVLSSSGKRPGGMAEWPAPATALFSLALEAEQRADEVKLTGAIGKLADEDPSLSMEQNPDTHQLLIWGQGEIHLLVAIDRLKSKYNLAVTSERPLVPYKETIRRSTSQHSRYKRQTGGHGQFGDVHIDIKPLPRGTGFEFADSVTGGAVPKQYIPSVETGVKEFLGKGTLGFPVVDLAVTLTDGQHHAVDSSDQAFKTAGRLAMSEGMPNCDPVLLEPIFEVRIAVPSEFTSNVQRIISSRRGQILGFDAKPGWEGWDEVSAHMPQSESHDLIVDLRSQTLGVGTFAWKFDHLQELTGRLADDVIKQASGGEKATA